MHEENLAQRYAQALWEAAKEANAIETVAEDLASLDELLRTIPELLDFLAHPKLDPSQKEAVILALKEKFHPYTVNLLRLLVRRGRAFLLLELLRAYFQVLEKAGGPMLVLVRTARPLTLEDRERIRMRLAQALGREVALEEEVAPELLAGVELVLSGRRLDASLRGRLLRLKRLLGG
jgi:F-type H+-transporting ATPase subunit delta